MSVELTLVDAEGTRVVLQGDSESTMSARMTDERLAQLEGCVFERGAARSTVAELLAEVKRLRALPRVDHVSVCCCGGLDCGWGLP